MKVDDVILGIDDQPFTDDARKTLAKAIQKAEKEPLKETGSNNSETGKKTRSGHLALLRWRACPATDGPLPGHNQTKP